MPEHATSRIRRLVAVASATLLVAAGLTSAAVGIAPTSADAAQNPTSCQGTVALVNGGFETPAVPASTFRLVAEDAVPGWFTNDSRNQIEFWGGGFQGVPAAEGRQFVELNANTASLLYQDIATSPGQTFGWSLKHRGRNGTDVMRVVIGAPGGVLTQNGPNLSDGSGAWGSHAGTYVVPAGQTVTRFGFEAVSSAGGNPSVGNLLDDIAFGTGPCLITTKSVTNVTRGGTGTQVGDVLRYTVATRNDGGNPALQTVSTDALPADVDLVTGSMRIITGPGVGPQTDAAADDRAEYSAGDRTVRVRLGGGATSSAGGSLAVGTSTSYSFEVKVTASAAASTIVNEARVAYRDTVAVPNLDRTSTSEEARTVVAAAADLAITKTLDTDPLVAGLPATFTIDVTNDGPQTATGVTVTDAIPAGLLNATAAPTRGSCTLSTTISCALPDLAVGESASVMVTGMVAPGVDPGAALTNTASVVGSRTDPDLADNTASASGTVTTVTDLSVQKTFSPASPVAGRNLTYTVTARNTGPSEARDVRLTDPLDPGEVFIAATPQQGTCAMANGVLDCELGTLAPGATVVTTIEVRVAPGTSAVVQNSASITSSTSEADPSDNVASVGFQPTIIADLSVQKTASAAEVAAGDALDFEIAVSNLGSADAVGVTLDDTLPSGLRVTGVDAPAGADCTFSDESLRCLWATFPVGGPSTVVVHAAVAADAPAGTLINTASVVSPSQDPDATNNADSARVEVTQSADVRVQKSAAATPVPGSSFDYRIAVANDGPSTARGVTVTDVLPVGFTFAGSEGDCTLTVGTLTCGFGDLAPGGSATVTVSGTWAVGQTGAVSNTATVGSATFDPDSSDDVSTDERRLAPSADVVVGKTSSTPTVPRGGQAVFVVSVRNDGPSAAADVVVAETLPPGLTLASAVPSTGSWSAGDALWTVGMLMPGASATLTVTADVVGEGTLTNTATATSQTPDPRASNNVGSATVVATPTADLSIVKTASATPASMNGPLDYTIVVTNAGPSAASAVRVGDVLPTALLTPSTSTPGCTIVAGTLECTVASLAAGASLTARVTGTVDPATAQTALSNTATVTSTTSDPRPQDNASTVVVPVTGTPRVELVKSASAPVDIDADERVDAGDTVAYAFTIRNTGDVTLTGAALDDPLLGGAVTCPGFTTPLAPGREAACGPVAYTLTQSDLDRGTIRNDASVVVQSARGSSTDTASATVTIPAVNGIALSKSPSVIVDANASGQVDAGDEIDYTFTVTNTGTTTLSGARITDPMLGGAVLCADLVGAAFAPGAVVTCDPVAYTLVQADIDGGAVANTASVTASAPTGDVTDAAAASADLDRTAGLDLIKTAGAVQDADGDGLVGAGDTVAYSFSVRNTGTTTLTGAEIIDPLLGDGTLCDQGALAPDAVEECGPFLYTLTQSDIEEERVLNTAVVAASSPLGQVTDESSAVVIIDATSAVELTKTPGAPVDENADGRIGAGDAVAFSFTVRNTGTTLLRDLAIDDPLLGGVLDCPALDLLELVPGAQAECGPVGYELTQPDVEDRVVRNAATVSGDSILGKVENEATAEVEVTGLSGLAVTKTASTVIDTVGDGRVGAGDTIEYTFRVENTGTTVLRDGRIDDPLLGGRLDCPALDAEEIAPGEDVGCGPAVYTLTQADIEAKVVRNTAAASADSVLGGAEGDASAEVEFAGTGTLELTKTPGAVTDTVADGRTGAGDTIGYTFTVQNTGTVILRDVVIDDALLGGAVDCPVLEGLELMPGTSVTCGPVPYALTQADVDAGTVRNAATVAAASTVGAVDDSTTADVLVPGIDGISLTKVASAVVDADGDGAIGEGDTVAYTFTVTNTGTTTLSAAELSDPMLGGTVDCPALDGVMLAPGAGVTCAAVPYALTQGDVDEGQVRNEASVRAEAPGGTTVGDSAAVDVGVVGAAGIEARKSAGTVNDVTRDGAVGAGDTVAFAFTVRNVGTTTLRDLVIDDPLLGGVIDCPALEGLELAPDAEAVCGPVEYTLSQEDVENEVVRNTATAAGRSPLGAVDDEATVIVGIDATSAVELAKIPGAIVDVDDDGMIGAGDTVGYSFTIRNTGTAILRDLVLDDPLLGGTLDCPALAGLALAPRAEASCGPLSYTLVQSDIDAGIVRNVADVRAKSSAGETEVSAAAEVIVSGSGRFTLQKSAAVVEDANGTGRTDAGDTIAYTFAVTNTGTTTLSGIAVADERLDGDVACDVTRLAPDEATVCSGPPAVLTQAEIDAGEIVNTATATAIGAGAEALSTASTIRTPLENQPAVALAKTGGEYVDENRNSRIDAGDTVAFRFAVTNTGARTVTDVVIDDPLLGRSLNCEIADLAPGGTADCGPVRYRLTAADVAAGEVVNVATVRGSAGGLAVTASATASVDVTWLAATGGVITGVGWALALAAAGALVLFISRSRRSARVYRDSA
ncbi:DUF11 domain-containing protein [Microbacterium sp. SA39]|uniref:DUF11 domain-containing protein n=1 Tax=Microbacterium sp. SA39 TaxID=1263625 RepID=UPI0005FA07B4|nr:DUF11 domain-containing protein [Microbacterium sp. SA39]KJQ53964.1 Large cysteine-rich periplasmic protein OmcB [Microbacterium sp. SA39]